MQKGNISVHTENIFPIIKKFLYHDHEIFLRELIANAVDATKKIKTLSSAGEFNGELGDLKIRVEIDEANKTLTIKDSGIGMTDVEIDKFINQIAFSSAEEFVNKFKDKEGANIIGHFGMGFYSSFMVSSSVDIISKSYKDDTKGAFWTCNGSTEYTITEHERTERGTDIVLHINEESEEFLQKHKIQELLNKYCRFLPVEIEFDGKVINNTQPAWTKKPSELTAEDYKQFYSELYPFSEPPLFWIHLNVDYPFNLTGILYFPKINKDIEPQRNKIQLYSNQVFVTDSVQEIVPEFLMLLHGIIDSPDIPLNVSRSALQSDSNVKKITSHITKKVADKLNELFNSDRKDFEDKWDYIDLFVKYGMVSDEKFNDRARNFCLLKNLEDKFFTLDEYKEKTRELQTNKDNKVVWLYTNNAKQQHNFIEAAAKRNYDVLKFEGILDNHFIGMIESKLEDVSIQRVDANTVDKLIDKGVQSESVLNEDQQKQLKDAFEKEINDTMFEIQTEALSPDDDLISITRPEFERRMREMSSMGGMSFLGNMPEKYKVILNNNHPVSRKIVEEGNEEKRKGMVRQSIDLALLSQNLLSGEALTKFIKRSVQLLEH